MDVFCCNENTTEEFLEECMVNVLTTKIRASVHFGQMLPSSPPADSEAPIALAAVQEQLAGLAPFAPDVPAEDPTVLAMRVISLTLNYWIVF